MALQYGFNFTESDMKRLLEQNDRQQNGVRSWRQLFGNASLGYNTQSDALRTDYASAIAEAYKSNFAQRNAIFGTGLNASGTQQLLNQSRADLHAAYDTYIRNYGSAASALAESYSKEMSAIDEDLTTRATNFKNLYNSAYKYLSEELYGSDYLKVKDWSWLASDPAELAKYGNNPAAIENATLGSLKSWNELSTILFDGQDNLTMEGTKFFDQIFNAQPQGNIRTDKDGNEISVRTFDQWLSDTNPTLRDWAASADVSNYTRAGTRLGTAKVNAGLESDDIKYHQSEYLTSDDAEKIVDKGTRFTPITFSSKLEKDLASLYASFTTDQAIMNNVRDSYSNVAQSGQRDAIEKKYTDASNQAVKEITSATSTATTNLTERLKDFETLVNQDNYTEFINSSEYTSARSAYDAAIDELIKRAKYVSTKEGRKEYDAALKEYEQAYKQILNSMSNFVKKHGYTGKTSGF
jgi:hypothetical protein